MAGKTKYKQTSPLQKSKRQKEKKQKWLNFVDEETEEYYNLKWESFCTEIEGIWEDSFEYPTTQRHEWELAEKETRECIQPLFRCATCGRLAVGKLIDRYAPSAYCYYMASEKDANMSCADFCAKDIIE